MTKKDKENLPQPNDQGAYEFGLDFEEYPVIIGGYPYILKEPDGDGRDVIMADMSGRLTVTGEGKDAKGRITRYKGMESTQVAVCLLHAAKNHPFPDDPTPHPFARCKEHTAELIGKPVKSSTVKGWPAKTQHGLFQLAQRIAGLDEEAKGRAKNDSSEENDGSG